MSKWSELESEIYGHLLQLAAEAHDPGYVSVRSAQGIAMEFNFRSQDPLFPRLLNSLVKKNLVKKLRFSNGRNYYRALTPVEIVALKSKGKHSYE
jgi:hypothetical protein